MEIEKTEYSAKCPIRTSMELIGGKWRLLLLQKIDAGKHRFAEIKNVVPDISDKVLATELKNLMEAGLVKQAADGSGYEVTELGQKALLLVPQLAEFGQEYLKIRMRQWKQ